MGDPAVHAVLAGPAAGEGTVAGLSDEDVLTTALVGQGAAAVSLNTICLFC